MASSTKISAAASRYAAFDDSRSSSVTSSTHSSSSSTSKPSSHSQIIARTMSAGALAPARAAKNEQSFGSMVKRFMKKKPEVVAPTLKIASDDLKKVVAGPGKGGSGGGGGGLPKKLFQKAMRPAKPQSEVKALTEVKENTRTLGMVLRNERELLNRSKALEEEIAELRLVLAARDGDLDKLRNLCMKQREEIKSLKNAIILPDAMDSQLQELLGKQGSEMKQARHLIPILQNQVASLTGQLRNLAEDLAEVKANKCSRRSANESLCYQEASNSLEASSWDPVTPGSLDEMFVKDLNPCLTPHYGRTKFKELVAPIGDGSPSECHFGDTKEENDDSQSGGIFNPSSDRYLSLGSGNACSVIWKSGQSKFFSKTPTRHKLF